MAAASITPTLPTLSANGQRTLAVHSDGTLWGWGANYYCHLGDGSCAPRHAPTRLSIATNWRSVSAGTGHALALRSDGTLWGWGYNTVGAIGNGGSAYAEPNPTRVDGSTNWAYASAGNHSSFGIKTDGTLWGWGSNNSGTLGDGSTENRPTPVQIGADNTWVAVGTGESRSVGLKSDGSLWGWGLGQLEPVRIGTDADWVDIFVSFNHSFALKSDGSLWGWGRAAYGLLGNGMFEIGDTLVQVGAVRQWRQAAAGWGHSAGIAIDGTLWVWGVNYAGELCGSNDLYSAVPIQVGTRTDWVRVSTGQHSTLAQASDGTTWGCGIDTYGDVGVGIPSKEFAPRKLSDLGPWSAVAAGLGHSVALKANGTLWAWGNETAPWAAEFGHNYRVIPTQISSATDWKSVVAGDSYSLALKLDGSLWGWGDNGAGTLLDSNGGYAASPVPIGSDTDWRQIAAGGSHALAIKTDGSLWAWGANWYGEIGDASTARRTERPVRVGSDADWISISAVRGNSFGVKSDGSLWGWGANHRGQIGDGTTVNRSIPTRSGGDANWLNAVAIFPSSLALRKDGSLSTYYTFNGAWSPLGYGSDWPDIAGGINHAAMLRLDGTLWMYGNSDFGQLGDGSIAGFGPPRRLAKTFWKRASVGVYHTLAIQADGSLWAWGDDSYGQLGLGRDRSVLRKAAFNRLAPYSTASLSSYLSIPSTTLGSNQSMSIRLTADGGGPLQLAAISPLAAPFSVSHNCPGTLAAGSSCDFTINFSPTEPGSYTQVFNITTSGSVSGVPIQISANAQSPLCAFDIDGDGKLSLASDGLLLTRYLLGLRGSALVRGAVAQGSPRLTSSQIENYLSMMVANRLFDVDANGVVDLWTDGRIIARALAGVSGPGITADALSSQPASRRSSWIGGPPGTNLKGYLSENCSLMTQ